MPVLVFHPPYQIHAMDARITLCNLKLFHISVNIFFRPKVAARGLHVTETQQWAATCQSTGSTLLLLLLTDYTRYFSADS